MTSVFVSVPMNGRTRDEWEEERDGLLKKAKDILKEDARLVPNCIDPDLSPLERQGESLKRMGGADYVVFSPEWRKARGCCIEHMCALEYGVRYLSPTAILRGWRDSDGRN